ICGTGIGMAIAANKVKGIRAAACSDVYSAKMSRRDNDANVLCFGGRVIGPGLAAEIVTAWLNESFAGGRHQRRVEKICQIEQASLDQASPGPSIVPPQAARRIVQTKSGRGIGHE
ncbi:MAG: RpiB/LacA/LacB family sugar-phosphate isomerase, partial [Candidatus Caldarchaeum sp.]